MRFALTEYQNNCQYHLPLVDSQEARYVVNIVQNILDFNVGRDPERLAMKYAKMRTSPYVFLRGTCHLFYDRLQVDSLPADAPTAWICGDLHLENFGSYKGDNRLVCFDINDFDESTLAPVSWDLVRLLASVFAAAASLRITGKQAALLCGEFMSAYGSALESGKASWIDRDSADGLVKTLLDALRNRSRVEHLDKYTKLAKKSRVIRCDGERSLKTSSKKTAHATELVEAYADTLKDKKFFDVIDVAHRIAGAGSLGVERYMVLVKGKGSPDENYLLDVKQAFPSSLARHVAVSRRRWSSQAGRVVTLQNRMQATSTAFLSAVTAAKGKCSYVVRALQPSADRVALDDPSVTFKQISDVVNQMGRIVAWAHLRGSGLEGSATADTLVAFGASRSIWQAQLLAAAQQCAAQTVDDWNAYVTAYDAGTFAR